jgi:uncharacterized cofD-like protein
MNKRKKVVVIGGGTGTFTVLSGLKKYPFDLTAIVTMADDGGSTGLLRDELGVLPPGDVRQCLVALSPSDQLMRNLMNYRFAAGGLKGHSFGNLLLSALEKITGSFDSAVEKAGEILRIEGRVVPVTLSKIRLYAQLNDGRILKGEHNIDVLKFSGKFKITRAWLKPAAKANPAALRAIREADVIVLAPGDFYTSLVPNFLVRGVPEAIRKSRAQKIQVSNLMNKVQHTKGFTVQDLAAAIETYVGVPMDKIIYNNKSPSKQLLKKYSGQGEEAVKVDKNISKDRFVGADLISEKVKSAQKGDALSRSFVRHDSAKLAKVIARIIKR